MNKRHPNVSYNPGTYVCDDQVEKWEGTRSILEVPVEVDRREVISGSQSLPDWFKGIQGPVGPPGRPVSG